MPDLFSFSSFFSCVWEYLCVRGDLLVGICILWFLHTLHELELCNSTLWPTHTHTITHTCAHRNTPSHSRGLLPESIVAFLMPLAVVRVWNWSAGLRICQPEPGVWDAPHFRPDPRHSLQNKTLLHLFSIVAVFFTIVCISRNRSMIYIVRRQRFTITLRYCIWLTLKLHVFHAGVIKRFYLIF